MHSILTPIVTSGWKISFRARFCRLSFKVQIKGTFKISIRNRFFSGSFWMITSVKKVAKSLLYGTEIKRQFSGFLFKIWILFVTLQLPSIKDEIIWKNLTEEQYFTTFFTKSLKKERPWVSEKLSCFWPNKEKCSLRKKSFVNDRKRKSFYCKVDMTRLKSCKSNSLLLGKIVLWKSL